MAGIAAFANIDIAAGKFERRVEPHVRGVLNRLVDGKQRCNLDQTANARHHDDAKHEADRLAFQPIVKSEDRHDGYSAGWGESPPVGLGSGWSPVVSAAGLGSLIVTQIL